ncbi:MAG: thiamine pyrophosphate-dependent enzyme [Acidimicrobiales bacterium]
MTSAGAAVVELLAASGVRRLYTVPGESYLGVLDAAAGHPAVTVVSTRHESGAAFMAEAEAKLTGRPAVALASRGPGAANLAIGVHTARHDSTPMVALLGQVPLGASGREAFQEVDLCALYAPLTKWSVRATRADRVPGIVADALRVAASGRPGPVAVELPADVLLEEIDPELWRSAVPRAGGADRCGSSPGRQELGEMASLLRSARSPVAIVGAGGRRARSELVAFAEAWGVGVYAAFRRQDVFPNEHRLYLGHLTLGTPDSNLAALRGADLVLALGTRLSEVTTQGWRLPSPSQAAIQVDLDPRVLGAGAGLRLGVAAGVGATLAALLPEAPAEPPPRGHAAGHAAYMAASTPPALPAASGAGVHPAAVVSRVAAHLPEGAIVANDAGNFAAFLHRYLRYSAPLSQLAPTSGAMGYGVPAAVAACLVDPGRPVVAVVGDGGLLMTGNELETACRLGVAPVVVAMRNQLYGTIASHQLRSFGRTSGADIGPVDLAAWARGLGAVAWSIRTEDEIGPAMEAALASGRPALLDVATDPEVLVPGD